MALGFVFGTMFLLFILMLPFGILLALIGITFKSLFAMALFALKYLLPYGIIGFLIARKRAQDIYFPMRKYFKYIVLSLGAGFALLLIHQKEIPASGTL